LRCINAVGSCQIANSTSHATITQVNNTEATVVSGITDYVYVARTTIQDFLQTNRDILFDTTLGTSGVPYNSVTGAFSLTAGKTYRLVFKPTSVGFSDNGGGYAIFSWVDATTNAELITRSGSRASSYGMSFIGTEGTLDIIYTPSANQTVKVRTIEVVGYVALQGGVSATPYATAFITQVGSTSLTGNVDIGDGTASTSTTTGALRVNGGLGVSGNISLGNVANLRIPGGSNGQVLSTDGSGNLSWTTDKASGVVNAGVSIALGNVEVQISTTGSRNLQMRSTSGSNFSALVSASAIYNNSAFAATSGGALTITSTFQNVNNFNLIVLGDTATYTIFDTTNGRMFRVTVIINGSFINNFISIERL